MSIFNRLAATFGWPTAGKPSESRADLAHANKLAEEGRFEEAVQLGTQINRLQQHNEIETKLVEWRRLAFTSLAPAHGRPDWPPRYTDPFSSLTGPPEIDASALSADQLGGALVHHGCLLVRGLMSALKAEQIREGIDRAFDGYDRYWSDGGERQTGPWYTPFPKEIPEGLADARRFVRQGEGVWTAESPRVLFDVIEAFKMAGVDRAIGGYLGERPAISLGKSTLRRVPITTGGDWHQDGSFMGVNIRTVNVWLALSDCGVDAPGLELVARRLPGLVQSGTHGAWFPWSVAPDVAERAAEGEPFVSPHFAPGDALLFDQMFLHRTGIKSGMTKSRYAIESWFFAPSAYAEKQLPILF